MRQSQLFTKTTKELPKDETSFNARILIKAGFADKLMAGVYSFLPLGWRVIDKIENIIRGEMNNVGGQEILMPSLQPKEIWKDTDIGPEDEKGWGRMREVMYQLKDKLGRDVGFGATHEEVAIELAKKYTHSYKDLPYAFYQFQTKFRQELRPKSGLIRGREFIMKDMYSFHKDAGELDDYYFKVGEAYKKVFDRTGCKSLMVEASGGSFTKNFSHEFQAISESGEDRIAHCDKCDFAQNIEIYKKDEIKKCPKCGGEIVVSKSIETGNIFRFYDKYTKAMGLYFTDEKGEKKPVHLASYGIGVTRLMGAIVEVHHDERGIIWPEEVAPFKAHLIELSGKNNASVRDAAGKLYNDLKKSGIEILYDDRDAGAGEKFADADLIGCPYRVVVSEKTLKENSVEVKKRNQEGAVFIGLEGVVDKLK